MKKLLLGLVVLPLMVSMPVVYAQTNTASSTTAAQADSALRSDHPQTYTVVEGDTLWAISGRFLSKPWLWKDLWHINPNIKNPDLIYPGDTIKLVYVDGKPMLMVDRGGVSSTAGGLKDCTTEATQKKMPDGTVKMMPKCRSSEMNSAIPPIPLETIGPFLSENRILMSDKQVSEAPYIITGERVAGGEGDVMFARGRFDQSISVYDIVRIGKSYRDPDTNEFLGMEIRGIGQGKVTTPDEDVSRVEILRSREEVVAEDRLIPAEETKLASYFLPQPPEKPITGKILSVIGSVDKLGQYNVILLSKGDRDGLKAGTVLSVYHEAGTAVDPITKEKIRLPSVSAGLIMVFRTFEKTSYAIVLQSERPLAVMDEVRNP